MYPKRSAYLSALAVMIPTVALAQPASSPKVDPSETAVLILDGSGSMWGQVDGVSKIEIAQAVIDDLMSTWDPKVQLGLMAYGHRREADCSDIETIIPVGRANTAAISNAVNEIKPLGRTPIASSIKKAAEELNYAQAKTNIILLSDGLESCNADPCGMASALEGQGIDFTAHVIGFGLREEETAQLKCIADNTGGKFFTAGTAGELTNALQQTVESMARSEVEYLLSETFDDDAERGTGLNYETFDQFTVVQGSVDIVGNGDYGIRCYGNRGGCVDMDGTTAGTNPTSVFVSREISFYGGENYVLTFMVSGNQRGYPADTLEVRVGDEVTKTLGPFESGASYKTFSIPFSPDWDKKMKISFTVPGVADLAGPFLDEVYVKTAGSE